MRFGWSSWHPAPPASCIGHQPAGCCAHCDNGRRHHGRFTSARESTYDFPVGHARKNPAPRKGAPPLRVSVPLTILRAIRVSDGSRTYQVEAVDDDFVHVRGTRLVIPIRPLDVQAIELHVGQRVPRYLRVKVATDRHAEILAAAAIVASIVGYPRIGKRGRTPGGPSDRVWTDHVALAHGDNPLEALAISSDPTPVSPHVRQKHGRIRYWLEQE